MVTELSFWDAEVSVDAVEEQAKFTGAETNFEMKLCGWNS